MPVTVRSPLAARRLRRLVGVGALSQPMPDRCYLVDAGWQHYRARRRRRALTVIAILIPSVILLEWWLRR